MKVDGEWKRTQPNPIAYEAATEPHDRGGILVAAVFDAFLAIYERRTADLLRLATSGSGILGPGAVHPDLVERLSDEAAKAAHHVLTMCIRALDYCPPVDITFGEYLRAIITGDYDLVEDDRLSIAWPSSRPSGGAASIRPTCAPWESKACSGARRRTMRLLTQASSSRSLGGCAEKYWIIFLPRQRAPRVSARSSLTCSVMFAESCTTG